MPHGLLHLHRIPTGREPGGHPAVAEVVLVEVGREPGPLDRLLKGPSQDGDALARLGLPPRGDMVKHPRGPLAVVGREPEAAKWSRMAW